jgi:hypothetical protein
MLAMIVQKLRVERVVGAQDPRKKGRITIYPRKPIHLLFYARE